ncbi:MAG: DNA-directed RNA polymerase subunit beta' [Patescibacteria group bacterium]
MTSAFPEKEQWQGNDFDAIRLRLASPEEIEKWSYGEVTKPETINYRTQKPEKEGLFDERIFGPTKDWECYCGKYKRVRHRGIICDKCGVEVTRSVVRRERFGHIKLAAPVSHIWFLRGVPSKIGLVLGLSVQDLEKVIYFASFIITAVDEEKKKQLLDQVNEEYKAKRKSIEAEFHKTATPNTKATKKASEEKNIAALKAERLAKLEEAVEIAKKELKALKVMEIISENQYQDLSLKYGQVFEAGIGAEALRQLLEELDLDKEISRLKKELAEPEAMRNKKLVRRLKLFNHLKSVRLKPSWMIMTVLPVIPPDLRPMVQLDGGRFATSDLNDLYRRIINRNNRLKRLTELNAPEVICRNEKRMLQEAVDALIDNGARHGKTVTASTGQRRMLKSIADILKGKQGRFRQNLLGKRVDYSGRSVIVVGPRLELNQCGLPKMMALELFKPFVISKLIEREYVHNVRSANRLIESKSAEVWDILEEIVKGSYVLLNRAPTLHRLGIQAFQPVLIEGKAIQIHPLVCPAFNADFDGDQMAVHVPITEEAKWEAKEIMLSGRNLLKPATGQPIVSPHQDMILGCYYMTKMTESRGLPKIFVNFNEAIMAWQTTHITLTEQVKVRHQSKLIETSVGRILFNNILPTELQFHNETMTSKGLKNLTARVLELKGTEVAAYLADKIKEVAFRHLTESGLSWGMADLPELQQRGELYYAADKQVASIEDQYDQGLLTIDERHIKIVEIWAHVKEQVTQLSRKTLDPLSPVFAMIESGARGSWAQLTQMMGMKGLVTNPAGETIELPVKGNFKEGFDVLEYFISTHGTRKGLSDTALRTSNAGYLTRRLIDVAQDIVIREEDCGDKEGLVWTSGESSEAGDSLGERVKGRFTVETVNNPKTNEVIVKKGELINSEQAKLIDSTSVPLVHIRSNLICKTKRGLCQKCYGWDLGFNRVVAQGTAVGIIAAQSIGEPGTQLTMRTFHTGGVASVEDITQGLPRVEEIFEARPIRKPAVLAEFDGQVEVVARGRQKVIILHHLGVTEETYHLSRYAGANVLVKNGAKVTTQTPLMKTAEGGEVKAQAPGVVELSDRQLIVKGEGEVVKELLVPLGFAVWVKDGDKVKKGQQLSEGPIDLAQLYQLTDVEIVQKYILREIQYIYSLQGQKLNDKHVEIIIRQMFSRFYVTEAGDTELLPGEIVSVALFEEANDKVKKKGKLALGDRVLLGVTKSSLSTDSFLSASSFQETARVLIDAAVTGKVDDLRGLKENVIIGRLIPAGTGYGDLQTEITKDMAIINKEREEARALREEEQAALAAQARAMMAELAVQVTEPVSGAATDSATEE